jgi:hypothetical protein
MEACHAVYLPVNLTQPLALAHESSMYAGLRVSEILYLNLGLK